MNEINDTIKFTLETEVNNKINFLDLTAVSYTHLDVYKRQTLWFSQLPQLTI